MPGDIPPRHPEQPGAGTGNSYGQKSERQLRPDRQDIALRAIAALGMLLAVVGWRISMGEPTEQMMLVLAGMTWIVAGGALVQNIYLCWIVRNWYECRVCEDTGLYPPRLTYDPISGRVVTPTACACSRGHDLSAADLNAIMAELRMRND